MKPYAHSVKGKEGEYIVFPHQLGVREHLKDCVIKDLHEIPEDYAICPDRRHPEVIIGDYGMVDGEMVQEVSYQKDRRCMGDRRKE